MLDIEASWSLISIGTGGNLRVAIDGVPVPNTQVATSSNGQAIRDNGAIIWGDVPVLAGQTVTLQWAGADVGGTLSIPPPGQQTEGHANLCIEVKSA